MVIRSDTPASAKVARDAAIFVVFISVVMMRPKPLSRTAAAECKVEIP
ncbi:Uncharacterised protein [Mycobacteroides abscessus subsp. abscessus]|nr:Uncharacterised protein [Mycobacteroides abscessus subsp. abscessus]